MIDFPASPTKWLDESNEPTPSTPPPAPEAQSG
jgi:hypothetical protein